MNMKTILTAIRGPQSVQVVHLTVYRRGARFALAGLVAAAAPMTYAVLAARMDAAIGMVVVGALSLALLPVATSPNHVACQ